jgi:hypothetical protein
LPICNQNDVRITHHFAIEIWHITLYDIPLFYCYISCLVIVVLIIISILVVRVGACAGADPRGSRGRLVRYPASVLRARGLRAECGLGDGSAATETDRRSGETKTRREDRAENEQRAARNHIS